MTQKKKAVFNWSGGKDSALALRNVLKENTFEVVSLLTTINKETSRSSIHEIPLEILKKQAQSIGIPLCTVALSGDLEGYAEAMYKIVKHFKNQGVTHFVFGDIFLNDIKAYRESNLNPHGIEVVEPLWDKPSEEVIKDFLKSGIKAKIIVVRADKLNEAYIGTELDKEFIESLPEGVDCCGENGEYHTLAYAGDLFKEEIGFSMGETKKLSYDIKLSTGETETFEYFQAQITT